MELIRAELLGGGSSNFAFRMEHLSEYADKIEEALRAGSQD